MGSKEALDAFIQGCNSEEKNSGFVWEIITALRSCDVDSDGKLKDLTVMRLRAVVGLKGKVGNGGTFGPAVNMRPLTPEEIATRENLLEGAPMHFKWHWQCAVEAVKILYKYDLNEEKAL